MNYNIPEPIEMTGNDTTEKRFKDGLTQMILQSQFLNNAKTVAPLKLDEADLNDISDFGMYSFTSDNGVKLKNTPEKTGAGTLYVYKLGNNSLVQTVFMINGNTYLRSKSVSWNYWRQTYGYKIVDSTMNANNLTEDGKYLARLNAHVGENFPEKAAGILTVENNPGDNAVIQIFTSVPTAKIYKRTRMAGAWSEWRSMATDADVLELQNGQKAIMNAFLETPTVIFPALPAGSNADNVTDHGTYGVVGSVAILENNFPTSLAGSLEVGRIGNVSIFQRYITLSGEEYLRTKSVNWGNWQKVIAVVAMVNSSQTHLDNFKEAGTYIKRELENTQPDKGFPETAAGVLTVSQYQKDSTVYQQYVSDNGNTYARVFVAGAWNPWNTTVMLTARIRPKLFTDVKPAEMSFDDLTAPGVYSSTTPVEGTNAPPGSTSGTLYVDRLGNVSTSQLYIDLNSRVYIRQKSVSWNSWSRIDNAVTILKNTDDINQLTKNGNYIQRFENPYWETLGYPTMVVGTLTVGNNSGDNATYQTYFAYNNLVFTRVRRGTDWTSWEQLAKASDVANNEAALEDILIRQKAYEQVVTLTTTATGAIVVPIDCLGNADFEKPLFKRNSTQSIIPASTTKIMTAMLAIDSGMPLNSELKVIASDLTPGSGYNLKTNDILTLKEALSNMMLPSSNTSATLVARVVAEYKGITVAEFIGLMNAKCVELGMVNTTYKNVAGQSATGQVTTPIDLARLTFYASKNFTMQSIWGKKTDVLNVKGPNERDVVITSSLGPIQDHDIWGIGGKTGTVGTVLNLAMHVKMRNGFKAIAVTMNSNGDLTRNRDFRDIVNNCRNKFSFTYPNIINELKNV